MPPKGVIRGSMVAKATSFLGQRRENTCKNWRRSSSCRFSSVRPLVRNSDRDLEQRCWHRTPLPQRTLSSSFLLLPRKSKAHKREMELKEEEKALILAGFGPICLPLSADSARVKGCWPARLVERSQKNAGFHHRRCKKNRARFGRSRKEKRVGVFYSRKSACFAALFMLGARLMLVKDDEKSLKESIK